MHILSNNPLLKRFTLLSEIITSIKIFCEDEVDMMYGTIDELFLLLPAIEHLTLTVWEIEAFVGGMIPQKLATSLIHLKDLRLEGMDYPKNHCLQILVLIIRASPNLEKLTLEVFDLDQDELIIEKFGLDVDYAVHMLEEMGIFDKLEEMGLFARDSIGSNSRLGLKRACLRDFWNHYRGVCTRGNPDL
ncbi:uncharacterized protein [Rutidosis leptorrhynchoides]|uniref:uncharacterized protein n=1 Tax=Rutidosis leptorrhynchoides TaxID=125765 RepID=UPI003A99A6C8